MSPHGITPQRERAGIGGGAQPRDVSMADSAKRMLSRASALEKSMMTEETGIEPLPLRKIEITDIGLRVNDGLSLEEWENFGRSVGRINNSLAWIVGDWMVYGAQMWGKDYDDAAKLVGRSKGTVYNWASVCTRVDFSRRREKLHFSHHVLVAEFDAQTQVVWLDHAEQNKLSVRKLAEAIEDARGIQPASRSPLLNNAHRKMFNRVWRSIEEGKSVSREQINHLRRWLDDIESSG